MDTGPVMKWDVGSSVLSMAVSHDGRHIVTGSHDLCVWDVRNGGLVLGPLERHAGWVWSVALSPDNAYIVSGSDDGTICILNSSTGDPIAQPLEEHTGTIRSIAFSPNGSHFVSGSDDRTIRTWDVHTNSSIGEPLREHTRPVRSVAYSPNGALIISGSADLTICIWNSMARTLVRKISSGHTNMVLSVAFSPNSSQIVSGSSDSTIRIWDVHSGTPIFEPLRGHTKQVNSVAFSPDGAYIISGSNDRTICIWDANTGNPTCQPLQRHTGSVQSVAFSSDGTHVISGSFDSTVCICKSFQTAPLGTQNSSLVDISSKMTMQETFERLIKYGCTNLSASIVATQDSQDAFASGGFGDVWRALLIDGTLVAIKTLRQRHLPKGTDKGTKRAAREMYIWSRLQHPNIQALLGIAVFQRELGMVSPWMEQGNLMKYLRENPNVERYQLCVQLVSGVSYLHNIGTVHGDLKANNVLVSKDGELKINDFDHAILSESTLRFSTTDKTGGGTMRWIAPELLQPEGEDEDMEVQSVAVRSKQTDIYALGMTMLEIITGAVPYAEYRNDQGIYRAIDRKEPPKRPKELIGADGQKEEMWGLLLRCWDYNPSLRPRASSIFTSTFNLAKCTLNVTEVSPPTFDLITSKMSVLELFKSLVAHGCTDLTSFLDMDQRESSVVASGGFGDIRRTTLGDGTLVAVKTIRLHILLKDDDKGMKRAVHEVYIWSKLRHPNIQELLGVVVFQGGLGMVSPWMGRGNLQHYIAANPDAERYSMCAQVASGVSYLHTLEMVHGDLKASNVLVSDDGILKLNNIDYAILSSDMLRLPVTTRPQGGTLRWMAPELFEPEEDGDKETETAASRSKLTDVYALGMTLLEIVTGAVPYAEYRNDQGVYRAIGKKEPPKRPKELSGSDEQTGKMWGLLLRCWDHNPSVRPRASSVFTSILDITKCTLVVAEDGSPTFDLITSKMSAQEMFESLVRHGCTDLTASLDMDRRGSSLVASGGFGDIRRTTLDDGIPVAVKTLRLHTLLKDDDKAIKRLVREVYAWSKLRHSNIQELWGVVVFQGGIGMVSPWMERGNLSEYIATHPDAERYSMCAQVASGVSYLHAIGMVHGDLKGNNVLVSDDGILKINDFDYTILTDTTLLFTATTRVGGGTLRWMAPELLQVVVEDEGETQYPDVRSKQTDIYALGMTMLEIFTGTVPYSEYRNDMSIYRAISQKKPPRRPKELSGTDERTARTWELLLQCWDHDPSARPDASYILEYFKSLIAAAFGD